MFDFHYSGNFQAEEKGTWFVGGGWRPRGWCPTCGTEIIYASGNAIRRTGEVIDRVNCNCGFSSEVYLVNWTGANVPPTADLAKAATIALSDADFVSNWARLRGVAPPTTKVEELIDRALGRGDQQAQQFLRDIQDWVLNRIPETK